MPARVAPAPSRQLFQARDRKRNERQRAARCRKKTSSAGCHGGAALEANLSTAGGSFLSGAPCFSRRQKFAECFVEIWPGLLLDFIECQPAAIEYDGAAGKLQHAGNVV